MTQQYLIQQCWHSFHFKSTHSSGRSSSWYSSLAHFIHLGCSSPQVFSNVNFSNFAGTLYHLNFALLISFVFKVVSTEVIFVAAGTAFNDGSCLAPS